MIEKTDIKNFIADVIKDDDITADEIHDDTILIGEEGIFFDSVDVLELIVELENKFGIKIKDNDIVQEKFQTFNTLYAFIIENAK